MKLTLVSACAVSTTIAAFLAVSAFAGTTIVGITSGQRGVSIDNSAVVGNATVFNGSTIQTADSSSVQMSTGARLGLGAGSRVKVFSNSVSLESGVAEVQNGSNFEVDARSLKIVASETGSVARVKLDGDDRVLVTALNAPVNVMNRDGLLVARVSPGLPLSFLPQAAASSAFDKTGCVVNKSGSAILVDGTGNLTYELRGANLTSGIGNSVHVKGTVTPGTPAGGANQIVTVTSSQITAKGGCSAALAKAGTGATLTAAGLGAAATTGAATGALAAGAAAAGGAAAAAGIGTTALVVGGVAVAAGATVGGLAAAGTFSSNY